MKKVLESKDNLPVNTNTSKAVFCGQCLVKMVPYRTGIRIINSLGYVFKADVSKCKKCNFKIIHKLGRDPIDKIPVRSGDLLPEVKCYQITENKKEYENHFLVDF